MAKLGVSREMLAGMLRKHREDDLAERALALSDDDSNTSPVRSAASSRLPVSRNAHRNTTGRYRS
jgi:hypothetical protein